jgi:hypothetical protein
MTLQSGTRDALDAFSAMGNLGRLPALFDDFAALEIVRGHATRATQLGAAAARYADGSSCLEGTAKSQRSAG